jgi:hypothetical protein
VAVDADLGLDALDLRAGKTKDGAGWDVACGAGVNDDQVAGPDLDLVVEDLGRVGGVQVAVAL